MIFNKKFYVLETIPRIGRYNQEKDVFKTYQKFSDVVKDWLKVDIQKFTRDIYCISSKRGSFRVNEVLSVKRLAEESIWRCAYEIEAKKK